MPGLPIRLLALVLLLGLIAPARADWIEVVAPSAFDFGSWSLAGSLRMDKLHCIGSADTPRRSGWTARDKTVNYRISVVGTTVAGAYALYLDGQNSSLPERRLPIRVFHEDVRAGGGREELFPGQTERHAHLGQFLGCPSGLNSSLSVEIDAVQLARVASGTYSETFRLDAVNTDASSSVTFTVTVRVQNGSLVQISRLDSVSFGSHGGIGDLLRREDFCIHSTSSGAAFRLTVRPRAGDQQRFTLVSSETGDAIPMQVSFSGSSAAAVVVPGSGVPGTGSARADCEARDNASLDLLIKEADLQAASSGRYSQTLVLLVEPL